MEGAIEPTMDEVKQKIFDLKNQIKELRGILYDMILEEQNRKIRIEIETHEHTTD